MRGCKDAGRRFRENLFEKKVLALSKNFMRDSWNEPISGTGQGNGMNEYQMNIHF